MSSDRKARVNKYPPQRPRACFSLTESEFEELTKKKLSSWCALWDLMLLESAEDRDGEDQQVAAGEDMQRKIRDKISELVKKEEALVDLYTKAAEVAKKKEEKFKNKIANLVEQIEKDKNLMNVYKEEAHSSSQL